MLQKSGYPSVVTGADLKNPLMVEAIMQYVDKLIKPGKSIDPDLLVEWFNQQEGEQIQDVGEVFNEVAKTKQLFKLVTKDKPGMPDFNDSQKFEVLANAASQLGIAPRLKISDLRDHNREAELYFLTEVYSHDLPDDVPKYVNEVLKKHGQTLKISALSELEQPETLVKVLNVLDPNVKFA